MNYTFDLRSELSLDNIRNNKKIILNSTSYMNFSKKNLNEFLQKKKLHFHLFKKKVRLFAPVGSKVSRLLDGGSHAARHCRGHAEPAVVQDLHGDLRAFISFTENIFFFSRNLI